MIIPQDITGKLNNQISANMRLLTNVAESLTKVRKAVITKMLDIFFKYFNDAMEGETCKAYPLATPTGMLGQNTPLGHNARCCNSVTLGLVIEGFSPLGRLVSSPTVDCIHYCAATVFLTLRNENFHGWR